MIYKKLLTGALVAGIAQAVLAASIIAGDAAKEKTEEAISDSLEQIIFVPHDVGAPKVTDAGGVRAMTKAPKLLLIAPEQLARTSSPAPTLYWYTSRATATPVYFTLTLDDPDVSEPIIVAEIGSYDGPGIYPISLADYGITLEDNRRYRWSVAVASADGTYSEEPDAQTLLEYRSSTALNAAPAAPLDQVASFANEGYWYDAIDIVSKRIEAGDTTAPWRQVRAQLLDQAKLALAARYDRQ
ncbi:MAG: DUF928 domain-containing protein [Geminicoccaceae bacterium]